MSKQLNEYVVNILVIIFIIGFCFCLAIYNINFNQKLKEIKEKVFIPVRHGVQQYSQYIIWKEKQLLVCLEDDAFNNVINKYMLNDSTTYTHEELFSKTNRYDIESALKTINNKSKWQMFLVIQDPIKRFLNNFIEFCSIYGMPNFINSDLCYSCNGSVQCFIINLYTEYYSRSKIYPPIIPNIKDKIFSPQTWRCNSYLDLHNYEKIRLEELSDVNINLRLFINYFNKAEMFKYNFIKDLINNYKMKHKKVNDYNKEILYNQIKNDSNLIQKLVTIYFYDFMSLEYNVPDFE